MSDLPSGLQFPALLLDASNPSLFCGVVEEDGRWLSQVSREGAALENLFPMVEEAVRSSGADLETIQSFIYCEGPGSVLGLRLAAMAIQTWRQLSSSTPTLYAYNGLQLCAHQLQQKLDGSEALLISDWKKNAWNAVRISPGQISQNEVIDDIALGETTLPLYHLPQRKGWQKPPENATTISYDPFGITKLDQMPDLLRKTETVELSQTAMNTFAKWTPSRHRAPKTNASA